ncbi:MAG TPA: Hvo_1808 family surface protein [Natrialbaceae archaeon]|nr:Hvo_1808 family surface protein [Natrialbaceae archaeon]
MSRALLIVGLAALVALAGCSAIDGGDGETPTATVPAPTDATETTTDTTGDTTSPETATATESGTAGEDRIGWENGYAFDDPIDVTPEDGFNDSEFAVVKARTMARVEKIRGREFESGASIRFISRETLEEEGLFTFEADPARDQLWEAAFVVGENETSAAELNELYDVVVDGYAGDGEVTLVVDNPERPRIDPGVLSHELAHILGGPRLQMGNYDGTVDQALVLRSVVEGNANFVEGQYLDRCEGEWSCLERPENATEVIDADRMNEGLFLWFAAPYTLGPGLMTHEYDEQGIEGVNEVYANAPASMEQVIHPDRYADETPTSVDVEDRSADDWDRQRASARRATNTLGETTLYTMFKANDVIGGPEPEINKAQRTGLNYTHPATDGWAGDAFAAYSNGSAGGYVLKTAWDSDRDAREFHDKYLELLDTKGATEVREGVYRIPDGPYADAFRVVRDGKTVTIVNAPTVGALDEVHPVE